MPTGGGGGGGAKTPFLKISGIAHSSGAGATSLAVTVPAGIANGDFMVMLFGTQPGPTVAPATPTGWTSIASTQVIGNASTILGCYRVASSEPASYTVSWTTAATADGVIVGFRGLTGVIDNSATNNTNATNGLNSMPAPGTLGSPVLYLFASNGPGSDVTNASGFLPLEPSVYHGFFTGYATVGIGFAVQLITPYPIYYTSIATDPLAAIAIGLH